MPQPHLRLRGLASLLVVLALGACEDPGDDTAEAGDDEPDPLTCEDDDRADAFTVDLAKTGERHTVTIVDAMPAEPVRGDNTWTIQLVDGDGNPQVEATVTELGEGEYEIKSLNLFMAGLWEVTFELSASEEDEPDTVMFSVCIL
jgi:hypothetical protein